MKSLLSFVFLSFSLGTGYSQENPGLIGLQSPPVIFQESLDKKTPPDFYKGKILVIDFWATWCAPCIATFPHFNELSKKYGSNDVVFAAITDEPANVARKFFDRTKKELDALKLSDTSKKTMNGFNVESIPYCVVIDKNNVVKWAGKSYDLTSGILSKVIKNKPLAQAAARPATPTLPKNKPIEQRSLFSFSVAKSDTNKISYEVGGYSRKTQKGLPGTCNC